MCRALYWALSREYKNKVKDMVPALKELTPSSKDGIHTHDENEKRLQSNTVSEQVQTDIIQTEYISAQRTKA